MRATTLVARLWLLGGSLVAANYDSRGPEVEFFYRAYRMDVDVSVAIFFDDPENANKDPNVEKPWQLGKYITKDNDDLDWPKGNRPNPFYGLNFHAWMAGVDKDGRYGRKDARTRIDDPVNPDFRAAFGDEKDENGNYIEPRKNIMRVPPDSGKALDPMKPDNTFANPNSLNKYSFTGFDPNQLLGGLNKAEKGKPLGNYFEFDNLLGIVAKRCSDLYKEKPDIARPHYEAMATALKNAQQARKMESRKYQLEAAIKVLEKYETDNKLQKGTISKQKGILKTTTKSVSTGKDTWFPGWKSDELDIEKTRKSWPKSLEKHKAAILGEKGAKTDDKRGVLGRFAQKWATGDLSFLNKDGVRVTDPGMGSNHIHLQVMRAQKRLMDAINLQIGDPKGNPGAGGCNWYQLRDPGDGSVPDPLRRRMAIAMLGEAMSFASL
ncbi:hypothetical protein VTK26DRAFT_9158 [Humicola hyalothermophila]